MEQLLVSDTRVSLLEALRRAPDDPAAWEAFVRHYGPILHAWCRKWRLQEADAQDVAQIVLTRLAVAFRDFRYDPDRSFRGWLWTVTHNACRTYLAAQRRPGCGTADSAVFEQLHSIEAQDDLAQRLEEAFDQELLEQAMARVRLRVEPRTWDAFRLQALEEYSGAETAERLGMKVAAVYVARSKVQRMLQEELARLEPG
jgi:RNA polymerase sigma-70 factor (ECF subfamily)